MKVEIDPRVNKQIRKLSNKDKAKIVSVVEIFEDNGFSVTEKHLKKLKENLWELRTGKWRLLFGLVRKQVIVVNLFAKKTQKMPMAEIEVAQRRLREYI